MANLETIVLLILAVGVLGFAVWISFLVHQVVQLGKKIVGDSKRDTHWDWLDK